MPFYSPHGDGGAWFFCVRANPSSTWRLATTIFGEPDYLDCGIPEEWNVCCPCASWDDGDWDISFVAGPVGGPYHLYSHDGMPGHEAKALAATVIDAGFARNQWSVTASRRGPVTIRHGNSVTEIALPELKYIYRIAYDPTNPHSLWISADINGRMTLLVIDGKHPDQALRVTSRKSDLYKGVPIGGGAVAYARRDLGGDFEARNIAIAEADDIEYESFTEITWQSYNDADSLSCIECFRKHLASALGFCKEIMNGHGEGAHLDHRLDLAAEVAQMENHARELGIDGYSKALRTLRHNMESNRWIPTDDDTSLLRRIWESSLGIGCTVCGNGK